MGKASKFLKSLFGFKSPEPPTDLNKQPKRRWSFIKHHHNLSNLSLSRPLETPVHHHHCSDRTAGENDDGGATGSSKHATAVAAATVAVAEAACAAAHAAAEVVRMTSRTTTGGGYGLPGEWAAVKIQAYFRAYLARKALRALKALVKLQALVRGHLLRKQAADDLRRLQALVRVQRRARAGQFQMVDSSQSTIKVTYTHPHGPTTPKKIEHILRTRKHNQPSILKNNGSRSYARFINGPLDDERNEKILEIDNTKSRMMQPRRRNLFQTDQISYSHSQSLTTSGGSTTQPPSLSPNPNTNGSCEVNSLNTPLKRSTHEVDEEVSLCTAQNIPPFYFVSAKGNASMRVSPFTPAKSDSSRSCLSGYSDHPNYMAYTESSRAKVRSISAPRQRSQFEFPNTTKRCSVYGYGLGMQRGSNLRDSFVSKAYPGSGRLDRLGMPVGGIGFRESEYSGSIWN